MTAEQAFLITYGLHNFVSHSPAAGRNTFVIQRREGTDMVRHARSLIEGSFGDRADIHLV